MGYTPALLGSIYPFDTKKATEQDMIDYADAFNTDRVFVTVTGGRYAGSTGKLVRFTSPVRYYTSVRNVFYGYFSEFENWFYAINTFEFPSKSKMVVSFGEKWLPSTISTRNCRISLKQPEMLTKIENEVTAPLAPSPLTGVLDLVDESIQVGTLVIAAYPRFPSALIYGIVTKIDHSGIVTIEVNDTEIAERCGKVCPFNVTVRNPHSIIVVNSSIEDSLAVRKLRL